jgi:hypothetical protein
LTPQQKRLCIMKYYCRNYVSLASGCYQLPHCLEDALRKAYPNPKDDFFKAHHKSLKKSP